MLVTCADTECKYYNPAGCTSNEVQHTADRFCITGRRKPRDYTAELMAHFNPGCHKENSKFKSNGKKIVK